MMKFLNSVVGKDCDGIVSLKPFPDIIRNGFHMCEMSVFDSSIIHYVADKSRSTIGGSHDITTVLPPLHIQNKAIDEMVKESQRCLSILETFGHEMDTNKYLLRKTKRRTRRIKQ